MVRAVRFYEQPAMLIESNGISKQDLSAHPLGCEYHWHLTVEGKKVDNCRLQMKPHPNLAVTLFIAT
ncbi:hypothetical protein chiPu_0019057 [Chiloscyllium punctatum]|uniref:Uncharacterized protein n=1 Tax=Chiloscyllium punctatum TaxID=137246 RepID=A0A401RQQ2_CHIPU|nr:hypothetical protein [Chiloscyllium punctatum]